MLTKEMLPTLPATPGVYFFKDERKKLLYVGKAKSLRKRVMSYTYESKKRPRRIRELIKRTEWVEYDLCGSELEALIVESRLIKEYQPSFNRAQKRFRRFRFIKIDACMAFPRVSVVSEIHGDDARYFGPFHSFDAAESAVGVIHKLFPIRVCEGPLVPNAQTRPCFEFHLERCHAPCADRISPEEYARMLEDVERFLRGENEIFLKRLIEKRDAASRVLEFEKAAHIQRQIKQIQYVLDRHRFCVNSVDHNDVAVIGVPGPGGQTVLLIRYGRLEAHERLVGSTKQRRSKLQRRVRQIYSMDTPPEGCTPFDVDAMNIISSWLYQHRDEQSIVHFHQDIEQFTDAILLTAERIRLLS